jgi:hypothetical protein
MKAAYLFATVVLLPASAVWADPISYYAGLSGSKEAPPNASPGTGLAYVTIDTVLNTLSVDVTFSGLVAGNTASHIHCCTAAPFAGTASVATTTPTFTGFPTGATSGVYSHIFDLSLSSSYRSGFITDHGGTTASAEADLAAGLAQGRAYLNIHSTAFPGGEIRGFLVPVPEPSTFLLAGAALLGLAMRHRRRA